MPINIPQLTSDTYSIISDDKNIIAYCITSGEENTTCLTCSVCNSTYTRSFMSRIHFRSSSARVYANRRICEDCLHDEQTARERETRVARERELHEEEVRASQVLSALSRVRSSNATQPVNIETYNPIGEALDLETNSITNYFAPDRWRPIPMRAESTQPQICWDTAIQDLGLNNETIVMDSIAPLEVVDDRENNSEISCEICGAPSTTWVNGEDRCDGCIDF